MPQGLNEQHKKSLKGTDGVAHGIWFSAFLRVRQRAFAHPACPHGVRSTAEVIVWPGAMGGGEHPMPGGQVQWATVDREGSCGKGWSLWGLVVLTDVTKDLDSSISNIFRSEVLSFIFAKTGW